MTAAVVGVVGLGLAVADADIRPSLERGRAVLLTVSVLAGIALGGALWIFRRWELALKADLPETALSRSYGQKLHVARLTVVIVSTILSILLALAVA